MCGRQTTSTLLRDSFLFLYSPLKLFYSPGLAGGCLWYHQYKTDLWLLPQVDFLCYVCHGSAPWLSHGERQAGIVLIYCVKSPVHRIVFIYNSVIPRYTVRSIYAENGGSLWKLAR